MIPRFDPIGIDRCHVTYQHAMNCRGFVRGVRKGRATTPGTTRGHHFDATNMISTSPSAPPSPVRTVALAWPRGGTSSRRRV